MKKTITLIILLIAFQFSGKAISYITFNNVYNATMATPKISTTTLLTGSSFKITSTSDFTNSGTTAHAVYYVTFSYTDTSGASHSYVGMVKSDINANSKSTALIFQQTTSLGVQTLTSPEVNFILVVPKYESSFAPNTSNYSINGSYSSNYLPPITTIQANNSVPVITSSASISMPGGIANVVTVTATDANNNLFVNSSAIKITGGTDQSLFSAISASGTKSSASGALSFVTAPTWTSNLDANSDHVYNVQVTATDSLGTTAVQNIQVTILQPTVSKSGTPSDFAYAQGHGPSVSQTINVSGSNLYSNVTLTAPTDFEISTSASGTYSSSLTLPYSSSAVPSTTIYVRLKSGKNAGSYSGDITISATDATTQLLSVTGTVNIATGLENTSGNNDIVVFTDNNKNIKIISESGKEIEKVSVYTVTGNLVLTENGNRPEITLKNGLKSGLYLITVNTGRNMISKKIIIQ